MTPQIATRAYELYEQRGRRDGQSVQDWNRRSGRFEKIKPSLNRKLKQKVGRQSKTKAESNPAAKVEAKPEAEIELRPIASGNHGHFDDAEDSCDLNWSF